MKKESVSTKVSETIRLYQWFISTIVSHGHISFSKLNELWVTSRMEEGCPLSRTTFNRYREGIKELYGIEILCEIGGNDKNKYYIRNKADLYDDSPLLWSTNAMALNALLYKHDSIRRRISIDQNFNMEHLDVIMEAIENHQVLLAITWDYKKRKHMSVRINPYGLVLRQNQWFIISITEGDYPSTCVEMLSMEGEPAYQYYMVSEFVQVENTGERFVQNKYFKLHKAISMAPELRHHKREESKKEIVLMANNTALMKIRSQNSFLYNVEEAENTAMSKVSLYCFGTDAAVDFILSLGPDVEIVGPNDIRDIVVSKLMSMCHDYFEVI
ncbi:MAG: WYL domain-containing protein [Bacteroidaceae bacterium]|nr:WYL domain-containing protein [Bacteroidaceae bacterium]